MYPFPSFEPVCCSMSSANCCLLTCLQVSQETGKVVWYSHLLKNFPQFAVIHTVKGFSIVNKAEVDIFLDFLFFSYGPMDIGKLISSSSAFYKSCLNIWKFTDHALLKHGLENFEHYFTGMWKRQWHPILVLLPGKSHGLRSLVGCGPWDREESDMTERLHIHFSLSCTGEGNGNPLQGSCLENPRDGGVWWAAQSWTRLKRLSSSSSY